MIDERLFSFFVKEFKSRLEAFVMTLLEQNIHIVLFNMGISYA